MRILSAFAIVAIAIAGLAGCGANRLVLQMAAGPQQELIIRDGNSVLVSTRKNVVQVQAMPQTGDGRVRLVVAIHNLQRKNETMRVTSISARGGGPDGKRAAVRLFTYDELMVEQQQSKNAAAVASVLSTMAGSMSSMSAASAMPTAPNYGTIQAQAAMNQSMAAQNVAMAEDSRRQSDANMEALSAENMKDHTLMPGEWYGGVIVLQAAERDESNKTVYSVSIPFGGETHEFQITQVAM